MLNTALEIQSGFELERFIPDIVIVGRTEWQVLTGFEGSGRCWWCGAELKGKSKKWCWGHGHEYYKHFAWTQARNWCCERQDGVCANCWRAFGENIYALEVHHIVPLNGLPRLMTAFNLPWNLIGFCHDCHQEVHAAMRPPKQSTMDSWRLADAVGQGVMPLKVEI